MYLFATWLISLVNSNISLLKIQYIFCDKIGWNSVLMHQWAHSKGVNLNVKVFVLVSSVLCLSTPLLVRSQCAFLLFVCFNNIFDFFFFTSVIITWKSPWALNVLKDSLHISFFLLIINYATFTETGHAYFYLRRTWTALYLYFAEGDVRVINCEHSTLGVHEG